VNEEIIVDLTNNRAISNIGGFAFVVNAASGGQLQAVGDATITFKSEDGATLYEGTQPASNAISKIEGCGVVAAILLLNFESGTQITFPNTPSKSKNFQESVHTVRKAIGAVLGLGSGIESIESQLEKYKLEKDEGIVITGTPDPDASGARADGAIFTVDGNLQVGCAMPSGPDALERTQTAARHSRPHPPARPPSRRAPRTRPRAPQRRSPSDTCRTPSILAPPRRSWPPASCATPARLCAPTRSPRRAAVADGGGIGGPAPAPAPPTALFIQPVESPGWGGVPVQPAETPPLISHAWPPDENACRF
jgi:hypothetical protein